MSDSLFDKYKMNIPNKILSIENIAKNIYDIPRVQAGNLTSIEGMSKTLEECRITINKLIESHKCQTNNTETS